MIVIYNLKENETVYCENCDKQIICGDTVVMELDYYFEFAEHIYCTDCKEDD